MFVVVVTEKGGGKQRLALDKNLVQIGRVHGNDVVLPRGNVSKNHAAIERRNDGFLLSDMGSTNGTYVNGRRILEPQMLKSEDKIYVGDFILNIESSGPSDGLPLKSSSPAPPKLPLVVSEKAPPLKAQRPSLPSPTLRSASPTEKRIPLPNLTAIQEVKPSSDPPPSAQRVSSMPPPPPLPHNEHSAKDGSANLVDSLIVQAAKQLNLPELIHGPMTLDFPTAAGLRAFIAQAVDKLKSEGRLPEGHIPGNIKGRVFRRGVFLGPLGPWLNDPAIRKVRISAPAAASIFASGKWKSAPESFESSDALRTASRMLSAGRVSITDGDSAARRFFTEEGWMVHVATGAENPFIVVDKTPAFDGPNYLGDADMHVLSEAIAADTKILVVGRTLSARRSVFFRILNMLPESAFVTTVGEIGSSALPAEQYATIDISTASDKSVAEVRTALGTAVSMNPDWLGITGLPPSTIQDVLAAAAGRLRVVAELPLGGEGTLNRELAVSLGAAGLSVTPEQAAVFLTEAFDIVVVADCAREEIIHVKSVFSTAVSPSGSWSPHILFSRDITE